MFVLVTDLAGQRVVILTPEPGPRDIEYAVGLADNVSTPARILDISQSDTAFRSIKISSPFNMTLAEAKTVAAVTGCDYFILVRTGAQRRSSFSKPDYFEAFGAHYLVSGRSGELIAWSLKSFEADSQQSADRALAESVGSTAREIAGRINAVRQTEMIMTTRPSIAEVPDPDSPAAVDLKPPIPYRRIRPEYTTTAFLYDVRATIDIEADIDLDGRILATRILRWAGFGLEESVEKAVRAMNWRPAMRKGKALPMRVLLRYNFTKVGKE